MYLNNIYTARRILFSKDNTLTPPCNQSPKQNRDCGCRCSLVTAELEVVKLDMTIMLNTIESKMSTIESKMPATEQVGNLSEHTRAK